jgi:hypothetical protein
MSLSTSMVARLSIMHLPPIGFGAQSGRHLLIPTA